MTVQEAEATIRDTCRKMSEDGWRDDIWNATDVLVAALRELESDMEDINDLAFREPPAVELEEEVE